MDNPLIKTIKIGFIGAGNMSQVMIKGIVESKLIRPDHIFVSNRTPGKLIKLEELYGVQTRKHNEQVVEECDVVILAMKPQDLPAAVEVIANHFEPHQTIISLAAGINLKSLERMANICVYLGSLSFEQNPDGQPHSSAGGASCWYFHCESLWFCLRLKTTSRKSKQGRKINLLFTCCC